jgi:hypothetical protein
MSKYIPHHEIEELYKLQLGWAVVITPEQARDWTVAYDAKELDNCGPDEFEDFLIEFDRKNKVRI